MSAGSSDDADERDQRRRRLARRLMSHGARTQTIQAFTGLTRHRLETLRHRWKVAAEDRQRGPSPTSFTEFFRSPAANQAASAAALYCALVAQPQGTPRSGTAWPSAVERGEQLCGMYETFTAAFPHLEFDFEKLVLLSRGLDQGIALQLSPCLHCGAPVLVDKLALRPTVCRSGCERLPERPSS